MRFALTSVVEWSDQDGAWFASKFITAMLQVGNKNALWRNELIARWNM